MMIQKLELTHFGKFQGKTISFHSGCNFIYGENEAGKTTIHTFIYAMLFGLEPSRGRAARNSLYLRYMPWEADGVYGGKLWFQKGGSTYRIQRSFLKENRSLQLYDETAGTFLEPADKLLADLLAPLNEITFRNTILVRQMQVVPDEDLMYELQNYAANLNTSKNMELNLKSALVSLEQQKKEKKKQLHPNALSRRMSREQELSGFEQHLSELTVPSHDETVPTASEESIRELTAKKEAVLQKQNLLQQTAPPRGALPQALLLLPIILLILSSIGSIAAYFLNRLSLVLPLLALGILFLILSIAANILRKKRLQALHLFEKNREEQQKAFTAELQSLTQQLQELDLISRQQIRLQEQQKLLIRQVQEQILGAKAEIGQLDAQLQTDVQLQLDIDALNLAQERLMDLSDNIQNSYGTRLQMEASRLLSKLTSGRYQKILLEQDFHIYLETPERRLPVEYLSRGSIEQVYLCLRIAAARLLAQDEPLPFLLDDVFVYYDDKRLRKTLSLLQSLDVQVIVFSCHKREEQLLRALSEAAPE